MVGLAEILASCFWLDLILEATASRIGFFCFLFFFLGGGGGSIKAQGPQPLLDGTCRLLSYHQSLLSHGPLAARI